MEPDQDYANLRDHIFRIEGAAKRIEQEYQEQQRKLAALPALIAACKQAYNVICDSEIYQQKENGEPTRCAAKARQAVLQQLDAAIAQAKGEATNHANQD